jgi:hypothetical protein
MLSSWKLVFLCLGLSFLQAWSFVILPSTTVVPSRSRSIILQNSDDHEDDTDAPLSEETKIPQLPAFGASSFSDEPEPSTTTIPVAKSSDKEASSKSTVVGLVAPKFQIQYTCKVCETRNSHMVSRIGT